MSRSPAEPLKIKELKDKDKKPFIDADLSSLYDKAYSELGLQQAKRDQLITIYIALFSVIVPVCFGVEALDPFLRGIILAAGAFVGLLFSMIVVRYRIYKEVYWLCCQTLTTLLSIKQEAYTKDGIQSVFFSCLKKRGKSYRKDPDDEDSPFLRRVYVKKNLFSAETLYFFIISFLTATIFGLAAFYLIPTSLIIKLIASLLIALLALFYLMYSYFSESIKVYKVLIDNSNASFNATYRKAWLLHFFI